MLTPHAAAAAPQDDATAGVAAAPEAMDMLPEAAVAAPADPTAGHDFDHGIAWAGQQQQDNPQDDHHADWQAAGGGWDGGQHAGGGPLPFEAAEAYDPAEQIQMPEDTDEMLVDYETEEFAGAPLEPEDAFLDAEAEASAAAAESGSGVTSSSGSGDEDSPGFEGRQETSWPASSEERASVVSSRLTLWQLWAPHFVCLHDNPCDVVWCGVMDALHCSAVCLLLRMLHHLAGHNLTVVSVLLFRLRPPALQQSPGQAVPRTAVPLSARPSTQEQALQEQ